MDLATEFARRGPWITQFVIDGIATDGDYQVTNDRRIQQFLERFPNGRTILELGSLEGGHIFSLANHPGVERVLRSKHAARTLRKRNLFGHCLASQMYNLSRRTLSSSSS